MELKPNGKDIPVTETNKNEYVEYGVCAVSRALFSFFTSL